MDKITKAAALATWMKLNCTRLQELFTFCVFGINLRSVIFLRNFHNTSDFTRDETNEKSDLKTVLIMKKDLFLRYLIRFFLRKFLPIGRFLRRLFERVFLQRMFLQRVRFQSKRFTRCKNSNAKFLRHVRFQVRKLMHKTNNADITTRICHNVLLRGVIYRDNLWSFLQHS